MSMQKIMSLPICLGIFLAGIVMIPVAFAGCGPGTVLVDGVCELAPTPESSTACGSGTTLVDGVCELDETTKSSFNVHRATLHHNCSCCNRRNNWGCRCCKERIKSTAKSVQQESVTRERIKTPPETKESSEFCQSCGTSLKPAARFCGKCGTPRS